MTPDPTITISCDALVAYSDDADAPAPEATEVVVIPALPPASLPDSCHPPSKEVKRRASVRQLMMSLTRLELLWAQGILSAVPYAQDDHGLPADLKKDTVHLPAFAVEELA